MGKTQPIRLVTCRCGKVALEAIGEPILGAACYCRSCQTAGGAFEAVAEAPPVLRTDGGTDYALFRKDRVRCARGAEFLAEHRLKPGSPTRRVVATCCNSPMFLEFTKGHWLSLYMERMAPEERPPIELRTMTKDLAVPVEFDDAIPAYNTHSGPFMWKLLWAWAAMGFRAPKIDYVKGKLE